MQLFRQIVCLCVREKFNEKFFVYECVQLLDSRVLVV